MLYDYNYFHKNLLANQSFSFEKYKNKTEFDIFLFQLSTESIYDLTEIDWSIFIEQIVKIGIEEFSKLIGWEQVQFKVLYYLQKNIASLCSVNSQIRNKVDTIEKDCARLIDKIINDTTPVECHGYFHGMPPLDFYQYMQSPTIFTEKTPMQRWIDMVRERKMAQNKKSFEDIEPDWWLDICYKNDLLSDGCLKIGSLYCTVNGDIVIPRKVLSDDVYIIRSAKFDSDFDTTYNKYFHESLGFGYLDWTSEQSFRDAFIVAWFFQHFSTYCGDNRVDKILLNAKLLTHFFPIYHQPFPCLFQSRYSSYIFLSKSSEFEMLHIDSEVHIRRREEYITDDKLQVATLTLSTEPYLYSQFLDIKCYYETRLNIVEDDPSAVIVCGRKEYGFIVFVLSLFANIIHKNAFLNHLEWTYYCFEGTSTYDDTSAFHYLPPIELSLKIIFEEYIARVLPVTKERICCDPNIDMQVYNDDNNWWNFVLQKEIELWENFKNDYLSVFFEENTQNKLSNYVTQFHDYLKQKYKLSSITSFSKVIRLVHSDVSKEIEIKLDKELISLIHKNAPAKVCNVLLEYKEHLATSIKLAPNIYDELEEIYGELGFTKDSFCRAMNRKLNKK